ncbi:pheA operon leader peptide PheL [Escherichia coli]|nr:MULTISPECIES: pheA operon leader peptide PheL [Enterobacteriaceae]EFM2063391.1 hypothetical protein [Escherichia coli]EGI6812214.1 hypothetical protein [Escherichia coli]EHB7665569.1 hypothetical protein [Escherichia coli]EHD2970513.1 hypothetical protein [Escherichia coli]EHE9876994.1 hypothetical protein [Escherichia coli]
MKQTSFFFAFFFTFP